ncbi:MAG: serine--tRNA ligase [Gammaproteobacteria bacterium]|nr:serine--tRNA ligase [Gammaproteobacteria bacterium]
MLDAKLLRKSPDMVHERLAIKGYKFDIEKFSRIDSERRLSLQEVERLQEERNTVSKSIGSKKKKNEDAEELLARMGNLNKSLSLEKSKYSSIDAAYQELLLEIPNLPAQEVPKGSSENENIELSRWGKPREFEFEAKDHVDLTNSGYLDFETASKITGSRFVVMHGAIARLHRALAQFMLDVHIAENGFSEVYVPYLVNRESLVATGQLPKFEKDQFRLTDPEDWYLTPTAEVPVTNIYRDRILEESDLPIRHVSHTPCFRSEAGSYGKDTRGMIRQHQFEKIELVMLTQPEKSWEALDELVNSASSILKKLDLPFRSVMLCGGDLGFSSAKTIDLEVWLPGQGVFREISSCSNFLDFQSRRLHTRYKAKNEKKTSLPHTLNGSGLAVGRALVAVIENYQDSSNNIVIPDCLRSYMDGQNYIDLDVRGT